MRRLSFRYSLRTLLLVITASALALGWLGLPTFRARQFLAAMERQDYAAAERLFVDQRDPFPGTWKEHEIFQPRAFLRPPSWDQLWRRERQLAVAVSYGDGGGIASCTVEIKATAVGLEQGMSIP
jgi:hypothetical protein